MKAEDQENWVEIELPNELFMQLALEAHEADRTLNDHINKVLLEFISRNKELKVDHSVDDHAINQS